MAAAEGEVVIMTHDELLNTIGHWNWVEPGAINALHAVVELHKPDQYGDCAGCDNRCGCFEGDVMDLNKWETCPTIQAIEKGLA